MATGELAGHGGAERDDAADRRDVQGGERDDVARDRDEFARQRDDDANERDRARRRRLWAEQVRAGAVARTDRSDAEFEQAQVDLQVALSHAEMLRAELGDLLDDARDERREAAQDRRSSEGDREASRADREASATDRWISAEDRDQAEIDESLARD